MNNNFKHCHVYKIRFPSSKVRFIHTSTVTGSHFCSGKNYAYVSRTSCFDWNMCETLGKLHNFMHDIMKIITIVFEIVGGGGGSSKPSEHQGSKFIPNRVGLTNLHKMK